MRPLRIDDLELDLAAYGARQADARAAATALREKRRIALGDVVTLLFENRETLRHQVQETLFGEQTTDLAKVGEELDAHNSQMPTSHELSARLLLKEEVRLAGIEHTISLTIGGETVKALGDEHHLRFPLNDEQRDTFRDPAVYAEVTVDHPNYAESTPIPAETRLSLLADLALDS